MNYLALLILSILLVACGGGSGGSSDLNGRTQSEIRSACVVSRGDGTPSALAVAADKARKECGLTEDESVKLLTQ